MTKKDMVKFIEASGCMINFNFNRIMKKDKKTVTEFYNHAVKYANGEFNK